MSSELKNTDNQSTLTADQLASYPVLLREYDPNWAVIFEEEKEKLWKTAGDSIEDIFHFGSTSVPGMLAKPTVDILVIMKKNIDLDAVCEVFKRASGCG